MNLVSHREDESIGLSGHEDKSRSVAGRHFPAIFLISLMIQISWRTCDGRLLGLSTTYGRTLRRALVAA
jgi:hypothetical protein